MAIEREYITMRRLLAVIRSAGLVAAGLTLLLSPSVNAQQEGSSREFVVEQLPGSCPGGFLPNDTYTGNDQPGEIVKTTDDGTSVIERWVVLPDAVAPVTGVVQDRSCAFDGDLIVVTGGNTPTVWRVTSAAVPTIVASLTAPVEGVVTVPSDPSRFGPVAGRILTSGTDRTYAIDAGGDIIALGEGAEFPASLVPTLEQTAPTDFSCSGVVADTITPAVAGVSATLTRADVPAFRQTAKTNGEGRFQFSGVCAGTYTVTLGASPE